MNTDNRTMLVGMVQGMPPNEIESYIHEEVQDGKTVYRVHVPYAPQSPYSQPCPNRTAAELRLWSIALGLLNAGDDRLLRMLKCYWG